MKGTHDIVFLYLVNDCFEKLHEVSILLCNVIPSSDDFKVAHYLVHLALVWDVKSSMALLLIFIEVG